MLLCMQLRLESTFSYCSIIFFNLVGLYIEQREGIYISKQGMVSLLSVELKWAYTNPCAMNFFLLIISHEAWELIMKLRRNLTLKLSE